MQGPFLLLRGISCISVADTFLLVGPIDVTFDVWGDFDDYQGGVYKRGSGAGYEGLHSVKIIGWVRPLISSLLLQLISFVQGTDPKEGDYWIVQNSCMSPLN